MKNIAQRGILVTVVIATALSVRAADLASNPIDVMEAHRSALVSVPPATSAELLATARSAVLSADDVNAAVAASAAAVAIRIQAYLQEGQRSDQASWRKPGWRGSAAISNDTRGRRRVFRR